MLPSRSTTRTAHLVTRMSPVFPEKSPHNYPSSLFSFSLPYRVNWLLYMRLKKAVKCKKDSCRFPHR